MSETIDDLYRRKADEMAAKLKASWDKSQFIDSLPNDEPRLWRTPATAAEIKKVLEDIEPMVKVGRSWNDAFLVMRPETMAHAMKIGDVVEHDGTPRYMFTHQFNYMPVYTNRFLFSTADMVPEQPVETTPVLPRLMAEHVPEVKQKDLSFWQAMVCVVVLGWILVSLGGAL
jgi:hypothetical protein